LLRFLGDRRLRDGGHEQLISNDKRFKPAFAERDKKQTMIDLQGISTNWFKNQLFPSTRLSMLRAQLFMWYGLRNVEATFCSWEKNTLNLNVTNCLELTHVEFHRAPSNILFRLKIYAKPPNQLFVQKPG
jgi:hypothetical protein